MNFENPGVVLLPPLESRGERTFYGAFEGGFSAGYWGPSAVSRVFEQLGVFLISFLHLFSSFLSVLLHNILQQCAAYMCPLPKVR